MWVSFHSDFILSLHLQLTGKVGCHPHPPETCGGSVDSRGLASFNFPSEAAQQPGVIVLCSSQV